MSGRLPFQLPGGLAALWIALLAEANEWDEYSVASLDKKILMILDAASEDGVAQMTEEPAWVATVLAGTHTALVSECLDAFASI